MPGVGMKVRVAGVAGSSVVIQDVVEAIAVVVADTDDAVGGRGRAYVMPGIAAMDVGKANVAGRIVSPHHIAKAVAVEVANADHVVRGGGCAEPMPGIAADV